MIFSSLLLLQICHTISFGYADKENFEHSLKFKALETLKGLYAKEVPSHLAFYMEGKFNGI